MADEELHFGVTLDDHMSGPAHDASKSLHDLGSNMTHAKGLLGELAGEFVRTVEPAEVLKDSFKEMGAGLKEMMGGLAKGEAKEVVSGMAESLAGLASALDLVVPGLGQAAAAVIRLGGAFASATVGILQQGAELALEASQMKASLIDMFGALGGGEKVGRETEEMLAGLSHQIGIARDQLAPFTKSFMAMGIEGEEALKKATLAAASAQAIMGDPSAANAFETLTKKIQVAAQTGQGLKLAAKSLQQLADMGIRVDDVASRMGVSSKALAAQLKAGTVNATKFGDALQDALIEKGQKPLARMGSSMSNIKKMFGQAFDEMFEDMTKAAEPFLTQIKDTVHLFDQSTESGRTLKTAVTAVYTKLFELGTKAIPVVRHGFMRILIASVEAYTLVKKHWNEIKLVFAGVEPAIRMVADQFDRIEKAVHAVEKLDQAFTNATSGIGQLAQPVGKNFSLGLADGIKDGSGDVTAAAHGAAKDAVKAANAGMDNHSPSRALFHVGKMGTAGLALGFKAHAPMVAHAARSVSVGAVASARVGATIRAGDYKPRRGEFGGGGRSSKGTSVEGGIHVHLTAPNGVTDAKELTEIAVAAIFERLQLHEGR